MFILDRVAPAVAGLALIAVAVPAVARAQNAQAGYEQTLAREEVIRADLDTQNGGLSAPLLHRVRLLVGEYEEVARRYPRSGYSDNALYQGAVLSADAFWHFAEDSDRRVSLRLFQALQARYPSSSLNNRVAAHTKRLLTPRPKAIATDDDRAVLTAIRREMLPDTLRVTLELEREASFHEERLDGPPRVFIDLKNTRVTPELRDATLGSSDEVLRQIRVGRQQGGATRVVLDLQGSTRHSVYPLYNPYRIVVDIERPGATAVASAGTPKEPRAEGTTSQAEPGATWTPETVSPEAPPNAGSPEAGSPEAASPKAASTGAPSTAAVVPATGSAPEDEVPPPVPPATNSKGGFSLSRQLGLGISRVVVDPGHGGHDPGARVKGMNEADLTLDVALRLEKLLTKVQGVEVVMTRRTNVYIPLEERTAIANRAGADLFLSVHVNASASPRARGIETYFLNFAPNKEAEAIAARENAGSAKTMNDLPDIVKAIALNNKIDESRDFAALVQTAMVDRLRKANRDTRNLGVKQAPFMVLIGATMPSVLAEISFLTNRQEAGLLKTQNYRQAIAEALFAGVSKYQKSLKAAQTAAVQ